MLTIIAAAALLAAQPIAEVPHLVRFATAVQAQDNAKELMAIAWVETRYRNHLVSKTGCCCYMQIKGGHYGNPSCDQLRADPWLCVVSAQRWLAYWRWHCGKRYLQCYNAGWRGKDDLGDGYAWKVKQKMKGME